MVQHVDQDQRNIPVPQEIRHRYSLWLLATQADNKLSALMLALAENNRRFFAGNPEINGFFEEPDSHDVEKIAWYKAMVFLYLMRYLSLTDLEKNAVPVQSETEAEITVNGIKPERAVAIAMDVLTIVGKSRESLSDNDSADQIILHKLSRQVTTGMNQEEIQDLIRADKDSNSETFKNPFWTRFRVGVSVVSSDSWLSNTAGLEIDVEFSGFPQEVIDEGYDNPRILQVGPRLNLAKLVETHPECVKNIWVRQIQIEPEDGEEVQKGKGTKKTIKLPRSKFSYVRAAVVDGVLPEAMYKELFNGKPEQRLLRTRSNINMI